MSEKKEDETNKENKVDKWINKIQDYIATRISAFVAFMFLLVALGSSITILVITKWPEYTFLTVLGPVTAGIIAYYNRTIAVILFALLILLILL